MTSSLHKSVVDRIDALGFADFGIADLAEITDDQAVGLRAFIAKNYHGSMDWLAETEERRNHPNHLWADAKSAIVLAFNYGPTSDPMQTLALTEKGTISVYARNRDYHDLMKGRLKEIAGLVANSTKADVKVFVDTAPLMEKPLAGLAGLGWQGKHTNLVSKDHGSWLFLGVILSSATISPNTSEPDHCGTCRQCLDICPTNAFPAPYQLDARRCISYLTIEHKGPVDLALRAKMGNRIYGCDDCLAICPWNKFASAASEAKLKARDDLNAPDLSALSRLTDAEFRTKFSGSPIKRIGRNRFLRNVLYAIGNSGKPELRGAASAHINSDDPTVKDAAEWAVGQLLIQV